MQNGMSDGETIGIPIGIGEGSHIRKAIVDKHARIGKNVMVCCKIDDLKYSDKTQRNCVHD